MPTLLLRLALTCIASTASCHDGGFRAAGVDQDQLPVVQERFVAPTGDDGNDGSSASPWATLEHALGKARAGTTITLRAGTYRERSVDAILRGQPTAPVVVRAAAGEVVVVDGALPDFDTRPERAWTLHDEALGIWRSQRTFERVDRVFGNLADDEGGYALVPYSDYASLAATSEDYSPTQPFYCGPGVCWNAQDQRIYVRLARSRYQEQLDLKTPRSVDAQRTRMRIYVRGSALMLRAPTAHVKLHGLVIRGAEYGLELAAGCHHVDVQDCTVEAGRYGVLVRGGCSDLAFHELRAHGHFPPWVPRSDVKEPAGRAPARSLQGAGVQIEGSNERIRIEKCRFESLFDGIDTTGASSFLTVRNCHFEEIRDDVFEIAAPSFQVEFADNVVTRAAAGVSWNGSQAPPRAQAGTKWIHHNVIDTSVPMLYGRSDPTNALPVSWRGNRGDGMATGRAFGLHETGGMTGPDPWKIYQNTLIGGDDVDGEGFGLAYRFEPFDPTMPHEVLNNVFVQRGEQWIARFSRVGDGSQVFDGNVWSRERAGAPLWKDLVRFGESKDFVSVAAFRASSHARSTRAHWAGGWEARGVEGDPKLGADFVPLPDGPASREGVELRGRTWPGAERSGYRGALAPR